MNIDFAKNNGLAPAIVQDISTGKVLMLGYMNEESLAITQQKGLVTFYSRSKKRIWTKGEESGNYLTVKEVLLDCDNDTLLIKAQPKGPVCHTGSDTCWKEENKTSDFIRELESIIESRKNSRDQNSYVASLFNKGINKIAQKVGEEAVEVVIEAKDSNAELFLNESADLLFHYLILLQAKGFKMEDVLAVLKQRNQKKDK